jgi:hypothetical protein
VIMANEWCLTIAERKKLWRILFFEGNGRGMKKILPKFFI